MADRYGHPRQTVFGRRHASAAASVSYSDTRQTLPPPPSPPQPQQQPNRPQPGPSSHQTPPSNTGSRRAIFQGQIIRRPTPGPGGSKPNEAVGPTWSSAALGGLEVEEDESASSDIVVRDRNGEVEMDEPPSLVVDDPDEIALDIRQENERERQRLADAVKNHQSIVNQSSVPAQPEELFEAVWASLRAKVAALSEDNWMYEKEEEPQSV